MVRYSPTSCSSVSPRRSTGGGPVGAVVWVRSARVAIGGRVPSPEMDFDLTIVGAGAIGCGLARELATQKPRLRVCVLDAEAGPAMHQSGRNSGVCHSGFNPAPGTLK